MPLQSPTNPLFTGAVKPGGRENLQSWSDIPSAYAPLHPCKTRRGKAMAEEWIDLCNPLVTGTVEPGESENLSSWSDIPSAHAPLHLHKTRKGKAKAAEQIDLYDSKTLQSPCSQGQSSSMEVKICRAGVIYQVLRPLSTHDVRPRKARQRLHIG